MKKTLLVTILILSIVLMGSLAFGNPAMLPKHPGYPMAATEDPVMGIPTANDPGQKVPSVEEAKEQAARFHDAHAVNQGKEYRPNVIHGQEAGTADASTNK